MSAVTPGGRSVECPALHRFHDGNRAVGLSASYGVTDSLIIASDYGSLKYTKEILVQDSESCFRRDLPVLCES